jgi:hypothetical protein
LCRDARRVGHYLFSISGFPPSPRTSSPMDCLRVLEDQQALLCTKCQFIVNPHNLAPHLRAAHAREVKVIGQPATVLAEECHRRLGLGRLPSFNTRIPTPAPTTGPIAGLKLSRGYGCHLCAVVRREVAGIAKHYTAKHPFIRGRNQPVPWRAVHCQQFAFRGPNRYLFRVRPPSYEEQELSARRTDVQHHQLRSVLQQEVLTHLDEQEAALTARQDHFLVTATRTEVSPWLEMTRWHQYLRDHPLKDLAALTAPYDASIEYLLAIVCDSLKRNVEAAYRAVCEDRINPFDQCRINTF